MAQPNEGIKGFGSEKVDGNQYIQMLNQQAAVENTANLLREQEASNRLLEANAALAAEANMLLAGMHQQLGLLTHATLGIAGLVSQQLGVQQAQLSLQQQQANQIERERDAKEFIYQMEKFVAVVEKFPDPVVRGYWAFRQVRAIEGSGFGTADLQDRNDKAAFDQTLARAKAVVNALSPEQSVELEQYLNAVPELRRLHKQNAAEGIPEAMPLKELRLDELNRQVPQKPKLGTIEWNDQSIARLSQSLDAIRGATSKRRWPLAAVAGFAVYIVMVTIINLVKPEGSEPVFLLCCAAPLCGVGIACAVYAMVGGYHRNIPDEYLKTTFGIESAKQSEKEVVNALSQHIANYKSYVETKAKLRQKAKALQAEVEAHNAKATQHNAERERMIAERQAQHAQQIAQWTNVTDTFLRLHPDVRQAQGMEEVIEEPIDQAALSEATSQLRVYADKMATLARIPKERAKVEAMWQESKQAGNRDGEKVAWKGLRQVDDFAKRCRAEAEEAARRLRAIDRELLAKVREVILTIPDAKVPAWTPELKDALRADELKVFAA